MIDASERLPEATRYLQNPTDDMQTETLAAAIGLVGHQLEGDFCTSTDISLSIRKSMSCKIEEIARHISQDRAPLRRAEVSLQEKYLYFICGDMQRFRSMIDTALIAVNRDDTSSDIRDIMQLMVQNIFLSLSLIKNEGQDGALLQNNPLQAIGEQHAPLERYLLAHVASDLTNDPVCHKQTAVLMCANIAGTSSYGRRFLMETVEILDAKYGYDNFIGDRVALHKNLGLARNIPSTPKYHDQKPTAHDPFPEIMIY